MTQPVAQVQIRALRRIGMGQALGAIFVISAAVLAFLFWLIYFKPAAGQSSRVVSVLPAVNAVLNGLSATFLVLAFVAVRRRRYARHASFIFAAVASSTLFFISYITYHHFHGDTKFLAEGPIRPIYFFILISHIVLSVAVVPLILTSLYLALSGKLATHRRVSRWTMPIWLYVSVTGVLIFAILKVLNVPVPA